MKKMLLLLPTLGMALSSCGIYDAMNAMQCNTQAIEYSTCAICENANAIEEASVGIEENRRQIELVNKRLAEMNSES